MSEQAQIQDVVVLFDSAGAAVTQELTVADFECLRRGERVLSGRAGEVVRAAYVTVGPGLKVTGIAFFLLPIDGSGRAPEAFNIPLQYLVANAGVRTDLGIGPVKVASRAQCPVPWVSVKLWEPEPVLEPGEGGPARMVQRTVFLNRLGLRSAPPAPAAIADIPDDRAPAVRAPASSEPRSTAAARRPRAPAARQEPAAIEQGYLQQVRKFRAEVLELKAALRAERERNRRLQALLRGDV